MNKYCVLSAITNNYDVIKDPTKEEGIDYLCYVDHPENYRSDVYQIKQIPDYIFKFLDNYHHFSIKLNPFSWTDCPIVLWIDSSIAIKRDILPLFKWFEKSDYEMAFGCHPWLSTCQQDNIAFSTGHPDMSDYEKDQTTKFIYENQLEHQIDVQTTIFLCKRTSLVSKFFDLVKYIEGYMTQKPGLCRQEQPIVMYVIRELFRDCPEKLCIFANNMPYNLENTYFSWNTHGENYTPYFRYINDRPWGSEDIWNSIPLWGRDFPLINIDTIN